MSFYVSTATFFLLHCDEWDRVVALPRHKFVTGATLLQLYFPPKKNAKYIRVIGILLALILVDGRVSIASKERTSVVLQLVTNVVLIEYT